MPKKFYTCIIVPDASHRLHKIKVAATTLYILAAIAIISFFVTVGLGFNYVHMAFRVADFDQLQAENSALKVETLNLEVSAKKLSSKITELEGLSQELTKVIESDAVLRRFKVNLAATAGGSRENLTTAQLIGADARTDVEGMRDRTIELESHFRLLEQVADQRALMVSRTPTIWPVQGRIGSYFGSRQDPFTGVPETHFGLDIIGAYGSPVKAPADGRVIYSQRMSDYGNLIIIDHGSGLSTRHGHLSRFNVKVGQTVSKGEVIGYVGTTGRTTGPHLHYEVRLNDRPVNPRNYLPRAD